MKKINSLILMFNSLSKGEKRYFKLNSALQQGDKEYMFLYRCIEKGLGSDEIKRAFLARNSNSSVEMAAKYLFDLLLDAIVDVQIHKNRNAKLTRDLLKAGALFEKGFYDDGLERFDYIQKSAEKFELPVIQLQACLSQLKYISLLQVHEVTEAQLMQQQKKVATLFKNMQNSAQHSFLYQIINHRLNHLGQVRTKQQKEELNDLLVSELNLVSRAVAGTFESRRTHLLFQAYYFLMINDHKPALKAFYELNELFELHKHLWIEVPADYLLTIEGILDSLRSIKRYDEMAFFIDKLGALNTTASIDDINTRRIIYTYRLITHLDKGDFDKARLLDKQFEEDLFLSINRMETGKQAELYLYRALVYLGIGEIETANKYLNKILLENSAYHSLPIYRTFRLIHLLIHSELGDHEYIKYEMRSFKRSLKIYGKINYKLEKAVFQFVQLGIIPADINERQKIWKKFEATFDQITGDKYENQLLTIFNFRLWIAAKLLKKPFATLLAAHSVSGTIGLA